MTLSFITEQLMNGVGYGLILFMMAAGLTIVFGVMDTMNLAHGSLFMLGAYFAATSYSLTGSFVLSVFCAVALTMLAGYLLETTLMRRIYHRHHMNQVVATFGVILVCNDLVKYVWGAAPVMAATPESLSGSVSILPGLDYSAFRLLIIGVGIAIAIVLYFIMVHTR